MSKAITLESKVTQFRDALDYGWDLGNLITGIPDFKVMECLGFTPQSWTRYRPLIIQYCQNNDLIKYETRDGIKIQSINIRMQYDKKEKMWYGKRIRELNKKNLTCLKCGMENPSDSKFCNKCGMQLEIKTGLCSKCGKTNPSGSSFCNSCGFTLQ